MTFRFKLLLSCILLQAGLSTSFADEKRVMPKDSSYFKTGFYGGAMVGYATDKLFNSNYYDGTPNGGITQEGIKVNPTSNTFTGDLVFGGRILLNNGFMPGFDITFSSIRSTWEMDFPYNDYVGNGGLPLHVKVQKLYTITPALILGKIFKEKYYIFTKLGLSISRLKTEVMTRDQFQSKHGQSEYLLGLNATVGLEYALCNNWSVVGLISYETSRASEYSSRGHQPYTGGYYTKDINYNKIRTTTYTQKIGVIYKF